MDSRELVKDDDESSSSIDPHDQFEQLLVRVTIVDKLHRAIDDLAKMTRGNIRKVKIDILDSQLRDIQATANTLEQRAKDIVRVQKQFILESLDTLALDTGIGEHIVGVEKSSNKRLDDIQQAIAYARIHAIKTMREEVDSIYGPLNEEVQSTADRLKKQISNSASLENQEDQERERLREIFSGLFETSKTAAEHVSSLVEYFGLIEEALVISETFTKTSQISGTVQHVLEQASKQAQIEPPDARKHEESIPHPPSPPEPLGSPKAAHADGIGSHIRNPAQLAFEDCYSELCADLRALEKNNISVEFAVPAIGFGISEKKNDGTFVCLVRPTNHTRPLVTLHLGEVPLKRHLWITWPYGTYPVGYEGDQYPLTEQGRRRVGATAFIAICDKLEYGNNGKKRLPEEVSAGAKARLQMLMLQPT